jgi:hypothetical protein
MRWGGRGRRRAGRRWWCRRRRRSRRCRRRGLEGGDGECAAAGVKVERMGDRPGGLKAERPAKDAIRGVGSGGELSGCLRPRGGGGRFEDADRETIRDAGGGQQPRRDALREGGQGGAGGGGETEAEEGRGLLVEQPLVADGAEGVTVDRAGRGDAGVDAGGFDGEIAGEEDGRVGGGHDDASAAGGDGERAHFERAAADGRLVEDAGDLQRCVGREGGAVVDGAVAVEIVDGKSHCCSCNWFKQAG